MEFFILKKGKPPLVCFPSLYLTPFGINSPFRGAFERLGYFDLGTRSTKASPLDGGLFLKKETQKLLFKRIRKVRRKLIASLVIGMSHVALYPHERNGVEFKKG